MKKKLQFIMFISCVALSLTACTTPRILSHDIDGMCLITQSDMLLSKKSLKTLNTHYMLTRADARVIPTMIGYNEIEVIPKSTRLSIFSVYEQYESAGFYGPSIVIKIEQGNHRGKTATIPSDAELLVDPITRKRTYKSGGRWFFADHKNSIYKVKGKTFFRYDVNNIKYNDEYLKKCNE